MQYCHRWRESKMEQHRRKLKITLHAKLSYKQSGVTCSNIHTWFSNVGHPILPGGQIKNCTCAIYHLITFFSFLEWKGESMWWENSFREKHVFEHHSLQMQCQFYINSSSTHFAKNVTVLSCKMTHCSLEKNISGESFQP